LSVRVALSLIAGALVVLVPRATGPDGLRASTLVGTLAAIEADTAGVAERVRVVDPSGRIGLQQRLNTERFDWEAAAPTAPAPVAQPVRTQYPAPVVSLSLDSTTVAAGHLVTVRWSVGNANAVHLLGAGIDTTALELSDAPRVQVQVRPVPVQQRSAAAPHQLV
jgi:hypothetical protein